MGMGSAPEQMGSSGMSRLLLEQTENAGFWLAFVPSMAWNILNPNEIYACHSRWMKL